MGAACSSAVTLLLAVTFALSSVQLSDCLSRGSSVVRHSVLDCGREWTPHGLRIQCKVHISMVGCSAHGNRTRIDQPLKAEARICSDDGNTCQNQVFAARVSCLGGTSVFASGAIAEGVFVVLLDKSRSQSSDAAKLSIKVARLRFVTMLPTFEPSDDEQTLDDHDVPAAIDTTESKIRAEICGGALHLRMVVPLLHYVGLGVLSNVAQHSLPVPDIIQAPSLGEPVPLEGVRSVRVQVGTPPLAGAFPGLQPEPTDLLLLFEPHPVRRARYLQRLRAELSERNRGTIVVLPIAVGAAAQEAAVSIAQGAAGPELAPDNACDASFHVVSWSVPVVTLRWVLGVLVPALAPEAQRVSLSVWQSAALGSAWRVLTKGLGQAERSGLSHLAIEWTPRDGVECLDVARTFYEEGFSRRGPIACMEARRGSVELSFKRSVAEIALEETLTLARRQLLSGSQLAPTPSWSVEAVLAVHHRFSIARIRSVSIGAGISADPNAPIEPDSTSSSGFWSVQLPDFYEMWLEARSLRAIGRSSLNSKLDDGSHGEVFLLTLEPRVEEWEALLASDMDGLGPRPDVLPGWAHTRHLVLPASVFDGQATVGWALETFFGGSARDIALFSLADSVFDISPWMAAGRHARRFKRVLVTGGGGGQPGEERAGCELAQKLASRLGYGLLRGRCPDAEQAAANVTVELFFERLG